jgi:hypothetical protein
MTAFMESSASWPNQSGWGGECASRFMSRWLLLSSRSWLRLTSVWRMRWRRIFRFDGWFLYNSDAIKIEIKGVNH